MRLLLLKKTNYIKMSRVDIKEGACMCICIQVVHENLSEEHQKSMIKAFGDVHLAKHIESKLKASEFVDTPFSANLSTLDGRLPPEEGGRLDATGTFSTLLREVHGLDEAQILVLSRYVETALGIRTDSWGSLDEDIANGILEKGRTI